MYSLSNGTYTPFFPEERGRPHKVKKTHDAKTCPLPLINNLTKHPCKQLSHLTDEVHNNQVQHNVGEDEISKSPFWRYSLEFGSITRIGLYAETHSQHKRSHARDES